MTDSADETKKPAPFKVCSGCGKEYSKEEWLKLPFAAGKNLSGVQDGKMDWAVAGDQRLTLRNCVSCPRATTLSVLDEDGPPEKKG